MDISIRSIMYLIGALLLILANGCGGRSAPRKAEPQSTPSDSSTTLGDTGQSHTPESKPMPIAEQDLKSRPGPDAPDPALQSPQKGLAVPEDPKLPPGMMEMMNMTGSNREKAEAWDKYARTLSLYHSLFAYSMRNAYNEEARLEKQRDEKAAASASAWQAAKRQGADIPPKVKEPGTKVYWLRCPVGQTWNGATCTGLRTAMDWNRAKRACPKGYRLPTIYEYLSLLCGEAGATIATWSAPAAISNDTVVKAAQSSQNAPRCSDRTRAGTGRQRT